MSSCSKIGKSCCLLCWRNSKNKQRSQWRKSRTLTSQHTHTHTHTHTRRRLCLDALPCFFFQIYHMEYIIYIFIYIKIHWRFLLYLNFRQYVLLFYISIFLIPDTHITSRDFAGFSNQCRSCKQRLMSNPPYKRCQQLKTRKSVKRAILRITWQHSQSIHQPLTPRLPFSLWRFTCVRCRHAFGI